MNAGCDGQSAAMVHSLLEDRILAELAAEPYLAAVCSHAMQGGRRLRAGLLLEGCAQDSDAAFNAAAAVELLHAATLVQDDILDRGSLRHGRPCTYLQFGAARALLSSDWLLVRALDLAAQVDRRFARAMNRAVREMICTEAKSLDAASTRLGPNEHAVDAILETAAGKTGGLFGLALYGAALLRGDSDEAGEAAQRLGVEVGITYQMLDDACDIYMSEEEAGKGVCQDLPAGRLTLPFLFALEHLAASGSGNAEAVALLINNQQLRSRLSSATMQQQHALLAAARTPSVRTRFDEWLRRRFTGHRREAARLAFLPAIEGWEARITHLLASCCSTGSGLGSYKGGRAECTSEHR